jgi:hypothetical protein
MARGKVWVVAGVYGGVLNGIRAFTNGASALRYARLLQIHANEDDDVRLFEVDLDHDPANGRDVDFGEMPTIKEFFSESKRGK